MKNNLDITSLILQLYSVILLLQDYNNRDLMQELQNQDEKYLKQIINNQNEILNLLRKEDNNAREVERKNWRKH